MEMVYMVWREHGDMPKCVHESMVEAQAEAKRLSKKHPGIEFHIIASVDIVKTDAPDIEVGDVVRLKNNWRSGYEHTVVWQRDGCPKVMVQFMSDIHMEVNIRDIELIRKGPKQIEFKNVSFCADGRMYYQGDYSLGMSRDAENLRDNGKKYHMILKEMP